MAFPPSHLASLGRQDGVEAGVRPGDLGKPQIFTREPEMGTGFKNRPRPGGLRG